MIDEKVRVYFEKIAKEFDDIYDDRGSLVNRLANRIFRKSLYERFSLTINACGNVQNKSILDIGCGSGRLSLLLAERGAKVIGIDYSTEMINLAKEHLNGYKARSHTELDIEFKCIDFMKDFSAEPFDITVAMGVFDYIEDAIPFLKKMGNLTKEKMIASYPAKFTLQTPIRKIWLSIRKCPVYFYTKSTLGKMYNSIGIYNYNVISMPTKAKIPTEYLVEANPQR